MNKKEMMERLIVRIKSCYKQLMSARGSGYSKPIYIEGFRCRLDELILYYQMIKDISFCEACKELCVPYQDVNILLEDES